MADEIGPADPSLLDVDVKQLAKDLREWEDLANGGSINVIIKEGTPRQASLRRLLNFVREQLPVAG